MTPALCAVLLWTAAAAGAGTLSADEYLALRRSLGATPPDFAALKSDPAGHIGKTIELKGTVNGTISCGGSKSFILKGDSESFAVRGGPELPSCVASGSTIRALVKIGPESRVSLSDLQLAGAAYDHDVSRREQELAPKPKPNAPAAVDRGATSPVLAQSQQANGANVPSRLAQIYEPYKRAIAKLNPTLTAKQLDTITTSILVFSEHYGVDPRFVVALFLVESRFKPNATSPKGAMGLGQLMPGTAKGLGVGNAYDPVQNIEASIRLIRGHLDKYKDVALALSAYNAGSGAVKKYGGVPPYQETQNYIRKVSATYKALCGE